MVVNSILDHGIPFLVFFHNLVAGVVVDPDDLCLKLPSMLNPSLLQVRGPSFVFSDLGCSSGFNCGNSSSLLLLLLLELPHEFVIFSSVGLL